MKLSATMALLFSNLEGGDLGVFGTTPWLTANLLSGEDDLGPTVGTIKNKHSCRYSIDYYPLVYESLNAWGQAAPLSDGLCASVN